MKYIVKIGTAQPVETANFIAPSYLDFTTTEEYFEATKKAILAQDFFKSEPVLFVEDRGAFGVDVMCMPD